MAFGAACVAIQICFGELHWSIPVVAVVALATAAVFWCTGLLL